MSDILIKNIEMPKSCYTCDFCNDINEDVEGTKSSYVCSLTGSIVHDYANGKASNLTNKRQRLSCCPLVEVKPHGRLVDIDRLIRKFRLWGSASVRRNNVEIADLLEHIAETDTVLEANHE